MTGEHRPSLRPNGSSLASNTGRALRARPEPPLEGAEPSVPADEATVEVGDEIATDDAGPVDADDTAVAVAAEHDAGDPDPDPVPESEADAPDADGRAAGQPRTPSRALLIATLIAMAALIFAVVAGVLWWRAGHDNSARKLAQARDAVNLQARLGFVAVTELDYRTAAADYSKWESVSTGALRNDFVSDRSADLAILKQARMVLTTTVLDTAVTDLNLGKGTATVLASADIKHQPASGKAATVRNRYSISMKRVDGQWKISNLGIVAVQAVLQS
jgi:Mce-associated membrane protein